MATASRSFRRSLLQVSRATPAKRKCIVQCRRPFSLTSFRGRDSEPEPTIPEPVYLKDIDETLAQIKSKGGLRSVPPEEEEALRVLYNPEPSEYMSPKSPLTLADLTADERADYEALTSDQQSDYLPRLNHYKALSESSSRRMNEDKADKIVSRFNRDHPERLIPQKATSVSTGAGYWAEDEDDELGQAADDDDEWDPSMITSVAENELQLHREIRQYTRAVAWEMPLLTKLVAKEFEVPTLSTPLRFRYTTYMGESHPAARKVVVEFTSQDLMRSVSLTEPQRLKLTKLLGPRYNPHNDTARMSCERFDHAAQNKRYLGDLIGSLVTTAKDSSDMFEDVPRDDRHAKVKPRVSFPEEWLLKGDRVKQLAEERKPKSAKPRVNRDVASRSAIADYMAKMPLGRRDAPWTQQTEKEPEMEPVRVR